MKIKDLSQSGEDEITSLLRRIPFYNEVLDNDGQQLKQLLIHSCIVELEPGETIMRRGDRGSWLYFLIKGRLQVYIESPPAGPINTITPGELFGDLALLCEHERKATVIADPQEREIVLFATDFKLFGELLDFDVVSLETKLIFYRIMVHSIRWRLEVNRMEVPKHPLALALRQTPTFTGSQGTVQELQSLLEQAQFLAELLDRWNSDGLAVQDIFVAEAGH